MKAPLLLSRPAGAAHRPSAPHGSERAGTPAPSSPPRSDARAAQRQATGSPIRPPSGGRRSRAAGGDEPNTPLLSFGL